MHTMVIDGIDDQLMQSIRARAEKAGMTPEQEVLTVLSSFARAPRFTDIGDAIMNFPNVGLDSDFERVN